MTPSIDVPAGQDAYPEARHAWRVIVLLVLVAIVATLDRGVLSLVIDPIRHDLGISDVQISLLQGLSFSLFYATVGVALGLWTDRVVRCRLLALGILIWSGATIAAGFSNGFWWMFASRLLVGMGEGTLGPCAISLMADLFAPARRGRPMGVFLMGQAISNGLSVLLTGAVLRHLPHDLVVTPTLSLHPWRVAFILTGALGLVVVPFMAALREPKRRETAFQGPAFRIGSSLRYMSARRGRLIPLYLGFASIAAGFYSTLAWGAVSITRHYGLAIIQVTGLLGPASIAAGLLGPTIAGTLVDHVMARQGARGRLRLLVLMPCLALPAMLCALMPTPSFAILCVATMLGGYPALATVFYSVLQGSVPNELRGFAISLTGLTNAVIGATGGPLLLAELGEHVFAGPAATANALSTTLLITAFLGGGFFLFAWRQEVAARRAESLSA